MKRTAASGLALAVLTAIGGRVLERSRLGPTDQDALVRIERELRERFDTSAATLGALTSRVATSGDLIRTAGRDRTSAGRLFETLDGALAVERARDAGISVFDANALPLAWSGRVSDINRERIDGPAVQYVAPGAFGPLLVRVEPVVDANHPGSARIGTVVGEQLLGKPQGAPGANRFVFSGSLVPVELQTSLSPRPAPNEHSFVIPSRGGQLLVEARVKPADIAVARDGWRARTRAVIFAIGAVTLFFCAAPFADFWRRARSRRNALLAGTALVVALVGARLLLRAATFAVLSTRLFAACELLFNALLLAAMVGLAVGAVEYWRVARPGRRLLPCAAGPRLKQAAVHLLAGVVDVTLLWAYERFLQGVVSSSTLDLLRFSLHPLTRGRLAVLFGLLLLHVSVIWGAALVIRVATLVARLPREGSRAIPVASWMAGAAAGLMATRSVLAAAPPVPLVPLLIAVSAAALCAVALARPRGPIRRASQAARFFGLYMALLVPALATYPSLLAFTTQAKEALVADTFGPQARNIREDLQRQLHEALAQIDARQGLDLLLSPTPRTAAPTTDQAFAVWSETVLMGSRLTSAVELFGANGAPISRFALNLPEYGASLPVTTGCRSNPAAPTRWDEIEEASYVLRASRAVCSPTGRQLGAVVVRVMLDYRTLPFISSASPYLESARFERLASPEESPGNDVEFAAYGWSRAPIYVDGTAVWRLPDPVFRRLVDSRVPFWETIPRGGDRFRVYFLNDRGGIYALGYPILTLFGHVINLAELVVLAGALYVLLLIGGSLVSAAASSRRATGRALLREVRSSFYRKLFLAFVAVAIVPATILAIATRDRLIKQFGDSVNESAVKTATVAQRLVEDYATLQQRGGRALEGIDDQILMLVERAIGQDVNLFDRATLQATSERDLFASRLFSVRTPAPVYRSVAIDRMPTFVSVEDVGGFTYLLAASLVRAGDSERIVTIPLTLRQRELDRQRDDLDRRVLSAFVLFVLLGAGLGYWMAERIADPVNRLTRATRRIARGDLDARIAATTSSDELRRLVEDFNHMAADLKRQRSELERSQRLEAWADMARQVAHDVKNPLTPIQLSAEHALRVNLDRGRPLSPVLEECVATILGQVRLLRQISAEFSSFASSPTARLEPTDLSTVIASVVEPYRMGLSGRISIDVQTDPALPPVTLDRTLFSRALTNVIENALHAMPGQGRLSITSRMSTRGTPTAVVTITDTGVGMDQEALGRIFEPNFSTRASGTGVGLTIAKRNVELNGGTIAVASQRGTGTTVTMILPLDLRPQDRLD